MQLEVCIETREGAELANQYDCHRIEVCTALDLGGLTPSYGLIEACTQLESIESHILIRPRAGNFIYTSKEIILMKDEIRISAEAGAKGVVFGCLNQNNDVDYASCELLIRFAHGYQLQTTFHRAIDYTKSYIQAFQEITDLGFDRVLTSGQKVSAAKGLDNIKLIAEINRGKIELMAGGGINAENAKLFQEIDLDAIHFSIRQKNPLISNVSMGLNYQCDETKLKEIIQIIRKNENN